MEEWGEWYTIRLTNVESTREELKNIDLSLQKIWEGDDEGTIAGNPENYARFQLMRTYHEEFLDCTNNNLNASDLVTVKLDLMDDSDPMELTVPRGAPVYITGMVKDGMAADLTFKKAGSADTLSLVYDNSSANEIAMAVTDSFAADNNIVWELQSGDAETLVGGKGGIRLASFDTKEGSFDISEEYEDLAFNYPLADGGQPAGQEFTLDNSNHWMKDWVDLPQVVQETTVNSETGHTVIKTIVYSYYLVEKGSNPSNYTAVFTDDEGYALGDEQKPVFTSTDITAENIETTQATVRKVWDDNDDEKQLRPASLTIDLYADGERTANTVTLNSDNWATGEIVTDLPKYNNGELIDYYWIEGDMPDGYFLKGISEEGTVTTLTNSYSEYDLETSYTGEKHWEDNSDLYSARPNELVIMLQRRISDNAGWSDYRNDPTWEKSGDTWTYLFEDLPVFDDNGNVYRYRVVETVPAGYGGQQSNTATDYQFGNLAYLDETESEQSITADNKLIWSLDSLIDLAFAAVEISANEPTIIWTSRTPTPQERAAIEGLLSGSNNPLPGHNSQLRWIHGSEISTEFEGSISFSTVDSDVTLEFDDPSRWPQFIVGQFNNESGSESTYDSGTTSFTNTLETVDISGVKIWDIDDQEAPEEPPILKLTRTVTVVTTEGDSIIETESTPEEVMVNQDDTQIAVTPTWAGSGTSLTYSYTGLPKYDHDGKEYHYHVDEISFTIGTGEDAVTYTVVRNQNDSSYTVTTDKEGAAVYTVSQTGNTITNSLVRADIEITKVEKGYKDSAHTLDGAQFRVTKVDENGNVITGTGAYQSEIQTVDPETGKTVFTGLKPGRYMLEEVEAPTGHVLVETPWYFNVNTSGAASLEEIYSMASDEGHANSFYIENEPGAALPNAGGHGTRHFVLLGLMLTAGAGLLLWQRRRMAYEKTRRKTK